MSGYMLWPGKGGIAHRAFVISSHSCKEEEDKDMDVTLRWSGKQKEKIICMLTYIHTAIDIISFFRPW